MKSNLKKEQVELLNIIARNLFNEEWISGRKLRASLGQERAPEDSQKVLDSLKPIYIRESGSRPNEQYSITVEGLLQSVATGETSNIIESVLSVLQSHFKVDPDFKEYTWNEVKNAAFIDDNKFQLAKTVIFVSNLSTGGGGSIGPHPNYRWNTPTSIEKLVRISTIQDFLQWKYHDTNTQSNFFGKLGQDQESYKIWSNEVVCLRADDIVADRRARLDALRLHSQVDFIIRDHFVVGKFRSAVLDATLTISTRIKRLIGRKDLDGKSLMTNAFSRNKPLLFINELKDEFDQGEQEGWMFLFMGAMQALRNPPAHRLDELDEDETVEILLFISLLHRKLDNLIKPGSSNNA